MHLSEQDRAAIEEAVRQAELATSGEIVFATADSSGRYRSAVFHGAILGMAAATAIYLALPIAHNIGLLLGIQFSAFALSFTLIPYLPFRRRLIPRRQMEEQVLEAAMREFYAGGLYRTREANGVLIYLSCLERHVVVLGDKGIHDKMGDDWWCGVRQAIIEGIHRGNAVEGICRAIAMCGKALVEHFPRPEDDTNELPDRVIDRRTDG